MTSGRTQDAAISGVKLSLPAIRSIGLSVWDPIYAKREHVGACWEVVHIVRGVVTLHLNGQVFRGKSGDTLLVPARTAHRDEFPLGSEFEVLHIEFQWDAAAALFPAAINADFVRLPHVDKQAIRQLAFDTYACFRARRLLWEELTDVCLLRLLLFLKACADELHGSAPVGGAADAKGRRRLMIQSAKEFIRDNLHKPVMLADIAAHLGVSAYHLSHLFSETSGFTLSSYLVNARMEKAAALLADPAMRVSEVASEVGFEDPNYFCKAFRRHFGCSPGTYRTRGGVITATKRP